MNTEKMLLENENEPSCLGAVMHSNLSLSDEIELEIAKILKKFQLFIVYKFYLY